MYIYIYKEREKERPLTCAIRTHPSMNYKERSHP